MSVTDQIIALAQQLADLRPTFFHKKGPGAGDHDTKNYMRELRASVKTATGTDYAEKQICGNNSLAVDYYIEKEQTVIEVALGLGNPNCEFERDILKVLMAQEAGVPVGRLILLAKPGGVRRARQPSSQAMIAWAARNHNLEIIARDLQPIAAVPN